jgi:hypothetical protein
VLIPVALCLIAIYVTGHWVAGAAVAVLLVSWLLLRPAEGPPVLALALTFQWVQVSIGIFFTPLTGIMLAALVDAEWLPMVLIGLGCVLSLIGLRIGIASFSGR